MIIGMTTTQIAVRLDDKYVAFLDEQVKAGKARSRAEIVESALERELRRRLYQRDAEIYATDGEDPELEGMYEWMRKNRRYPDLDA